ncbi:MAG: hypothetical protein GY853_16420 [PVC group bacterium]|nr:hypothetical protein [PVC group bacterium]
MVKTEKKDVLIKELALRRDEVVKRAAMVANRKLPQKVLNSVSTEADILEWIITPHIRPEYDPIQDVSEEVIRRGTDIVSAYLHEKGESDEEEKTTTDK